MGHCVTDRPARAATQPTAPGTPLHQVPRWHEESSAAPGAPLPCISPCGGALHGPRPPITKVCRAGGRVSCSQILLAPHTCSCQPPPPYSCRCRCMNGGVSQGELRVWCPLTACRESVGAGRENSLSNKPSTPFISLLYTPTPPADTPTLSARVTPLTAAVREGDLGPLGALTCRKGGRTL